MAFMEAEEAYEKVDRNVLWTALGIYGRNAPTSSEEY